MSRSRQEVEQLRCRVDISPSTSPQGGTKKPKRSNRTTQTPTGDIPYPLPFQPKAACLLKAAHYVVLGSIGISETLLTPMRMVMDTGSGPSVVQESTLPKGWKAYAAQTGNIPQLADANGNPLRITGRIKLLIQLGRKLLDAEFFVAPKLAVPVILGTGIMNSHVEAIRCRAQRIDVHDGGSIAILLMQNVSKMNNSSSSCYIHDSSPSQGTDLDHQSNRIRLAREITLPP